MNDAHLCGSVINGIHLYVFISLSSPALMILPPDCHIFLFFIIQTSEWSKFVRYTGEQKVQKPNSCHFHLKKKTKFCSLSFLLLCGTFMQRSLKLNYRIRLDMRRGLTRKRRNKTISTQSTERKKHTRTPWQIAYIWMKWTKRAKRNVTKWKIHKKYIFTRNRHGKKKN